MNKATIFTIFVVLIFSFVPTLCKVDAQSSPVLVISEYESVNELQELFSKSTRVLTYLNSSEMETGVFLGLVTEENIDFLKKDEYNIRILDTSPSIDRYILLYHPQKNKGDLLSDLGEINQITPHFTLLKLDEGKEFVHDGVGVEFFENPFLAGISPPPNATPVLPQSENITPVLQQEPASEGSENGIILVLAITLTVLIIFGLGVIWYIKKRKANSSF